MAITKRYYIKKKKKVIFYQAEYFSKGVRIASRSFSKKKNAQLWLKEFKENTYSVTTFNKDITFKNCVDQFFVDAKTRLTPSTFKNYSCQARYLYHSPLRSIKISDLKGIYIAQWLLWMRNQTTSRNKKRKNFFAELKLLSSILNWYKNYVNEDFNIPITRKHKKMCVYKMVTPRPMNYFIKPSDCRNWVKWLKRNKEPVYWKLVLFMLSTGVRVGEACGIKWSDIDFEQGISRLTQKVKWDVSSRKPFIEDVFKTPAERILIIPKPLSAVLLRMKEISKTELIFVNKKNEMLKYTTIQSNFNAGFIALGLPWRSTHICRHTFATMALMGTKNLSAVQAILGHTEPKTTQRYAKIVSLLNSNIGEKTFDLLFKSKLLE